MIEVISTRQASLLLFSRCVWDHWAWYFCRRTPEYIRFPHVACFFPLLQTPCGIPRGLSCFFEIILTGIRMDPFCGCWSRALFWELALCPKFSRYSLVLNDILPPALQLIPKIIFDHRVVWIVRNVLDLVRITFQIEKFDPGFD